MVCHIGTFRAHFHVSDLFFLSGAKRPSIFTSMWCREFCKQRCIDLLFQDDIWEPGVLVGVFYWFISNLYVLFLSNHVSGSVRPFMYGRVANPPVRGGSTHLKNIPTCSSGVGTGGGIDIFFVIWVMRFVG